jgi:TPR repeat protein
MLKILNARFNSVALWFYNKASGVAGGISKALNLQGLSSLLARCFSKPTPILLVELFVALSLTVNFFFLVKPMCLPKHDGNMFSAMLFSYMSNTMHVAKDIVPMIWRTRLLAPIVSGSFLDATYHQPYNPMSEEFQNVFGFYFAAWIFLLFLALILFRKDALLVMLGVFAGLMYNLIEPAGMYYYPWDGPSIFLFTLICLLYDRKQFGWLVVAVILGGLIKETLLCCALLILLGEYWPWKKRIIGFLAAVIVTMVGNKLLIIHYGVHAPVFTMSDSSSLADSFGIHELFDNARALFSAHLNHLVFVNAGSLLIVMLLPWRNWRDVLFKLLILVFSAGQFLYAINTEFRDWYELLPLGWMLLSERISDWRQKAIEVQTLPKAVAPAKKAAVQKSAESASTMAGRVMEGSYWLMACSLFALLFGIYLVAEIHPPPPPLTPQQQLAALTAKAQSGDADSQYKLGVACEQNQDYTGAVNWLQKAAQQGHIAAENTLGVLQAQRQDYTDAAQWFQRAAAQGDAGAETDLAILELNGYGMKSDATAAAALLEKAAGQGVAQAQFILGQLYEQGQGVKQDYIQAYKWFKLADDQGYANAEKELNTCSQSMTPDQINSAQQLVKVARNQP